MKKLLLGAALAIFPLTAGASAIITDGNVSLGVDDYGQLNIGGGVADVTGFTGVGVRWIDGSGAQYESTAHGCLCEGWGVAINGTTSGSANNNFGAPVGLTLDSFSSTSTTAQSVTELSGTGLKIQHDFAVAAETDDLMRVRVTLTNTSGASMSDVTYRRAMDWDTSPTPFDEYVSIQGTGTTSLLAFSSNNGFASTDPLSAAGFAGGFDCGQNVDFTDCGPQDHGAVFDFNLGTIDVGDSYTFDIFYGGAESNAAALAALGSVGAELYSTGRSCGDTDGDGIADFSGSYTTPGGFSDNCGVTLGAATPTFIFAFKGVGGTVIVPPPSGIPLPAGAWLLIGGLGALGGLRRLRRARD